MPLTIQTLNAMMSAVTIGQKFAARSASAPIGTRHLNNCLGVALHNPQARVGAIAHVEAQSDNIVYSQAANAVLVAMLADLNANGGGVGNFSLALLGNRAPTRLMIDLDPFGARLDATDFIDRRGQEGSFVLDPVAGILHVDKFGGKIADMKDSGVTVYAIQ